MKLSVVIVEDNPLTVRSLVQTMDWNSLNCEVAGTAMDGESGKKLILETHPDILLMDIRMPQCSGIDMLEAVREEIPDSKAIIITGYDHFQYASKAIKLGVFDYLLKPIRNDEVADSIRKARAEIERSRVAAETELQEDTFRRQAQLLSLLTNPSQRGQGVHQVLEDLHLRFEAYYIMTVQIRGEETFNQGTLNHLERIIASWNLHAVPVLLYDAMVIFVMRDAQDEGWKSEAASLSERVAEEMVSPVCIGISSQGSSLHAIRQIYQQARQAMWEANLSPQQGTMITFFEPNDKRSHPSPQVAEFNQRLASLIEKAELSDESAREAAKELIELSGHQYSQLRAMIAMYSLALRNKFGAPSDLQTDAVMYESWFVTSPEETEKCLLRMCAALRSNTREQQYSLLTRNTLQYIKLHAVEGLTLGSVADAMFVSSNYLSALIRKETGITFHEHVLYAKMAVARGMLSDPRILVEEVARAVGYSNYISFYNAFKRVEHMTPTEYRNGKVRA